MGSPSFRGTHTKLTQMVSAAICQKLHFAEGIFQENKPLRTTSPLIISNQVTTIKVIAGERVIG